ncbi:MAG: hypothetical protein ACYTGN_03745 [Planctomycetota bacterium]
MPALGLAPYLPPNRPRAQPRWWVACGNPVVLEECAAPPETICVDGPCGLAAPTSLPAEFLDYLEAAKLRPDKLTANRLCAHARTFAARRQRGERHPRRSDTESLSALDRRRLPLFHAALPLLERKPLEVDVPAYLKEHELPHTGLRGPLPDAVRKRRDIVRALRLEIVDRDVAIASYDALRALVAFAAVT